MADPTISELLERRSYSIERTGYSSTEVHRLLRELASAHEAGLPLTPIIDAVNLKEVSFGYDITAVTETLLAISQSEARAHSEPVAPAAEEAADERADVPPMRRVSSNPVRKSPAPPAHKEVAGAGHLSQDRVALIQEISSIRFRVVRSGERYRMDSVDDLLDECGSMLSHGWSVLPALRQHTLVQEVFVEGYDKFSVDMFLQRLAKLDQGADPSDSAPVPYVVGPPPTTSGEHTVRKAFVIFFVIMMAMILLGVFA